MHSVLMDDACILKTHVFMQRWCDIAIVVFIIKSPHLAYSVDNRQHSTSATLNIGLNIGFSEHRNNRLNVTSVKLYQRQQTTLPATAENIYTSNNRNMYTRHNKEHSIIKVQIQINSQIK